MTLYIDNDNITSSHTSHSARLLPGDEAQWEVSWLPGQPMDRTHAIAAIGLADLTKNDERTSSSLSPEIIDIAAQLMPGLDDPSLTPDPPARTERGKDGQLSDPEAGG